MGRKSHADASWLISLFDPEDAHHARALRDLDSLTSAPSISTIVLAELLVEFDRNDFGDRSESLLEIKRSLTSIVEVSADIAIKAAEVRATQKVSLGDAIVIATALLTRSDLLTFDKNMKAVYERLK